ncbi:MAG: hypothetical protein J1E40_05895 [Oscillospiraceae bacterium]|nr:hypothetical protein [Oscillospiraceae bacterium]
MKKILAAAMAVFTAAVMAGCSSTADEQLIEDISEDTSIAAETEASETAETSGTEETESVSEEETETSVEDTVPETEADAEPRLAQQEDLLGAWVIPITDPSITDPDASILGEGIMIFTNNAVKAFYEDEYIDINYTIKDGRPVPSGEIDPYISYDDSTYLTISGNTLYSNTEDNEPGAAYRYEHEPVALNYFDGEYISVFCGGEDIGSVIIENGAGTSEEDDLEIKLSLKGDTVSLTLNGEEDEFSYYIIETDYQERYIYFVNDNTIVILLKDIDEE